MVTFVGTSIQGLDSVLQNGLSVSFPLEHPRPPLEVGGYDAQPILLSGALDNELPVEVISRVLQGTEIKTFFHDFYNRIYLIPASMDFAAITENTSRRLAVWNAYLTTRVLENIVGHDVDGVQISGPGLPKTFLPLALWNYDITVSTDGPPSLDGNYEFFFDTPEVVNLPLSGQRSRLWPFPPNWRQSYNLSQEYRTEIFKSENGREQRRALRQAPRKQVDFTVTLLGAEDLRKLNQLMAYWQDKSFVLIDYPREVISSDGMPANSDIIVVDEARNWLVADATVVLRYGSRAEVRVVDSLAGLSVKFKNTGETAWPEGTKIHPGLPGNLEAEISANRPTNTTTEVSVRFVVRPGFEPVINYGLADVTFDGREVLMVKPNWSSAPTVNYVHNIEMVDFGQGRTARFSPEPFAKSVYRATYTGRDYEAMDKLERFFNRMKGQRGEFYMPSWENDLPIKVISAAGTNSIRTDGLGAYEAYANDQVHRAICVLLTDGTYLFGKVQSIYAVEDTVGTDTVIQTDATWPQDLTPENVLMVCWMPVRRFASDIFSTEWITNSRAQTQLSMRSLENLSGV